VWLVLPGPGRPEVCRRLAGRSPVADVLSPRPAADPQRREALLARHDTLQGTAAAAAAVATVDVESVNRAVESPTIPRRVEIRQLVPNATRHKRGAAGNKLLL
jgi:hypothetical protein